MASKSLPNIDHLSLPDLKELIARAERIIARKKDEAKADTLNKLKALASAEGFTFDELVGRTSGRRQRSDKGVKLKPKYMGPNGETYTGRGPTPGWLKALEAKGHKRERYLVK
ncbi:MAG: H-NS histone family protein [Alphaproteobacteria bacterium]|nr:H-NS histone family protein [Alphaproteobacteria bacterium]